MQDKWKTIENVAWAVGILAAWVICTFMVWQFSEAIWAEGVRAK